MTAIDQIDARDRLIDQVRRAADEHPRAADTTIQVCPQGKHLKVARRWQHTCDGCGEPLATGAVGVATWCDSGPNPCPTGGYDWQHGCGRWNAPSEILVALGDDQVTERTETAMSWWRTETAGEDYDADDPDDQATLDRLLDENFREVATEFIDETVARLDEMQREETEEAAEEMRSRLLRELNEVITEYHHRVGQGEDAEDVAWELPTGSEVQPGVYLDRLAREPANEGIWVAWDFDPRSEPDEDESEPVAVTPDDFEFVGVTEAARIVGVTPSAIRKHHTRGTMPHPVPVAGSDALVWHRSDIDAWAEGRRGPGRPAKPE